MTRAQKQIGIVLAVLNRLNNDRLPRALVLRTKVNRGECLSEVEREFLRRVSDEADSMRTLVEQNPEYKKLHSQVTELYSEIARKGRENAEAEHSRNSRVRPTD